MTQQTITCPDTQRYLIGVLENAAYIIQDSDDGIKRITTAINRANDREDYYNAALLSADTVMQWINQRITQQGKNLKTISPDSAVIFLRDLCNELRGMHNAAPYQYDHMPPPDCDSEEEES